MVSKTQKHDLKRDKLTYREKKILDVYDTLTETSSIAQGDALRLVAVSSATSPEYIIRLIEKRLKLTQET